MIGIDIVEISEFGKNVEKGGKAFLAKVFSQKELANNNNEHLAGIFAAKEAVIKALGSYKGNLKDIEIKKIDGRPVASVGGRKINISIAHHGQYAVAAAVLNEKI